MSRSEIIPKQASGLKNETFGDGVLLYHQTIREAIHLNSSAAVVWALCDGNNSMVDIENILIETYPDGKSSMKTDVTFVLEKLQQNNVIEF